jgi:hypothetical protein
MRHGRSTKARKAASAPLVLYGPDAAGKPRAAYFAAPDVELALKAAGLMGLKVLQVVRPEQQQIAAKLPAGRIYSNGRGLVPAIRRDLYGKLAEAWRGEIGNGQQPSRAIAAAEHRASTVSGMPPAAAAKIVAASPRLPASWDGITVGDLVIAQDADPKEGWWQAIVVQQAADNFTLAWHGFPHQKKVIRHRFSLALMHQDDATQVASATAMRAAKTSARPAAPKAGPQSASAEPPNRYPKSWDDIGVGALVLAKEEVPVPPGWWEAVVIEQDGDVFTLRWRDYPAVPTIVRHRLSLALLCPTPIETTAHKG